MHKVFGDGELVIDRVRELKSMLVTGQFEMSDVITRWRFISSALKLEPQMIAIPMDRLV